MIIQSLTLETILYQNKGLFHPVVPFVPWQDKLLRMDFTAANRKLSDALISDTTLFSDYVDTTLQESGSRYGIGGYGENRTIYTRSHVFQPAGTQSDRRSLHIGIDIWGKPGTPVFAPLGGVIHSFAYNDNFGDYGATIILLHQLNGSVLHTLYGHLSIRNLGNLEEGKYVAIGEPIGNFGEPSENGNWPPHLHFRIIKDMEGKYGDYPGVCSVGEAEKYLHNCPDPDLILGMMPFAE